MRRSISIALWLGGFAAMVGIAFPSMATAQSHDMAASRSARSANHKQDPGFVLLESEAEAPVKLRAPIQLDAKQWKLAQVLDAIAQQLGVDLMYDVLALSDTSRITAKFNKVTGVHALLSVLHRTGLQIEVNGDGSAARIRRVNESSEISGPHLTGAIVGVVADSSSRRAVANADVFLKGTHWLTMTDTNGHYRLADVDSGTYTLVVRRLGYAKQSRLVTVRDGQSDTVNIFLKSVAARLQDIVTTAAGRRRRLDIANDITTINVDSVMQAAPIRNVTDLLESRVPGLTVQRTSGAPGDPARLRLRGASSPLLNNDPIVIVDGIRVYAQQSASRSANLAVARAPGDTGYANTNSFGFTHPPYATPSPLDYIDPNTIETIEVLKGPSAASLYGQDAANGVIVITTKRGKAGPTRWTASLDQSRTQMAETNYPTLYLRWGHALYGGNLAACPVTNYTGLVGNEGEPCVGDSIVTYQLLNDPTLSPLNRGHATMLSLGASGGTQTLTYAVTGTYQYDLGIVGLPSYEVDRYRSLYSGATPPDWMQRPLNLAQWGVTSTITARLGSKADLVLGTAFSHTRQQKSSLLDQIRNLMITYFNRSTGEYYQPGGEGDFGSTTVDIFGNYYERATDGAMSFTNHLSSTYRAQPWLTFSADAGLNVDHRSDNIFFPRGPVNNYYSFFDTTGYVGDGQGTTIVTTVNLGASAIAPLGRGFQFQAAAGINYAGTTANDISSGSSNLAPGTSLQGSILRFLSRNETSDATLGWFVAPSVGNSKIHFTSGLRFGTGSSYGPRVGGLGLALPSLGVSYVASDEPWFPLKNLFQMFRLRLSYGRAIRQPGPAGRDRLFGIPTGVFADSQLTNAVTLSSLGNPDVRPERSGEIEGGFDTDLLDSRLQLDISGYRKTNSDALLSVPVPPSVYGNGMTIEKNIGVTRNTGITATVGANVLRTRGVNMWLRGWVEQRRDIVISLAPGLAPFYTQGSVDGGGARIAPGYPLNGLWSLPIAGYSDENGDGALEINEIQLGDTAVYMGNTLPNFTSGFNANLTLWHSVTVNTGFTYDNGTTQRNEVAHFLSPFSAGRQVPGVPLAEQVNSIDILLPALLHGVEGTSDVSSDYNFVQTVSTLRFNELGVSYTVPQNMAHRLGMQTLTFALQGRNLGLWTNYRGLDPNVNAFGTGNAITDSGILPQPRTWQVRVNATY